MLCAIPALRALRAGLPDARVTLVGLPWAQAIVDRFPRYVDDLVRFPGFPGIPEAPPAVGELPAFLAAMQARRFDLAVQMHGSGPISNPFTVLLGASRTAGSCLPGHYRPDGDFVRYRDDLHEIRRLTAITRALGMPDSGDELEWPVTAADRAELSAEADGLLADTYAVVHVGANHGARCWAPERFAAAAGRIAAEGVQVVLTGTARDAAVTAAVRSAMSAKPLDLTGRTTLGALGALVSDARLVLCNDTGVSHVAAALRVPSVVVFSASDPRRWAPLDRERHVAVHAARGRDEGGVVELEPVIEALERQLRREGERVA